MYRAFQEPEGATNELEQLIAEALPVLEAAGDDVALYIAYEAAAQVANTHALADAALEAFERANAHASRVRIGRGFDGWLALFRVEGATPIPEALAWMDQQGVHPSAHVRENRARALAMLGRFSEARATVAELRRELANRGDRRTLANMLGFGGIEVELLADDPSAAVEAGLEASQMFEELGDRSTYSTVAGLLAGALCAAGRVDEAAAWAGRAAELGASDDAYTQHLWRQARARVLASRGEHREAERLAREAVAIADETGFVNAQAGAFVSLGEVLSLGGKTHEAHAALEQALARYERKRNLVMDERVRKRLTSLNEAILA